MAHSQTTSLQSQSNNIHDLRMTLMTKSVKITKNECLNLVKSMKDRVRIVIEERENIIKI